MSTYCAISRNGTFHFGCDRKIVADNEIYEAHSSFLKYHKTRDTVFAFPGSPGFLQSFQYFSMESEFETPRTSLELHKVALEFQEFLYEHCYFNPSEEPGFADFVAEALVVNRYGIFSIHPSREVVQHDRCFAVGSGKEFALGALAAFWDQPIDNTKMLETSIKLTSQFDVYTGNESTILEL